ncbi:Unannotated [Lentimonas sp. CC4]|nr:Unannotated [Lentimonas sp. CC4]CAA6685756.1 Unannotated [Lentimonas sp. CC6]CAA7076230.1 Unannotated [Lentimonas sp. CC4]CAA7168717.1 Unannotated [Lentimonas sp. CC21]CAA7183456.1 Unannotated [Lentimonas sp. CC8]
MAGLFFVRNYRWGLRVFRASRLSTAISMSYFSGRWIRLLFDSEVFRKPSIKGIDLILSHTGDYVFWYPDRLAFNQVNVRCHLFSDR